MRIISYIFAFFLFSAAAEVYFVPGWRTGFDGRDGCVRILKDTYPGQKITVKSWDSMQSWEIAKNNAANYTKVLLKEILEMPASRRRELILVGHSIGAQIVVDILNDLSRRQLKIHSMALLGGAISDNDPRIDGALDAIRFYCCNIYNPDDWVLKYLFPLDNEMRVPLGLNGWSGRDYRVVEARAVSDRYGFANHYAYIYLEELDRLLEHLPSEFPEVEVPQDHPNKVRRPADMLYWRTVTSYGKWQLQKHLYGKYRILDDHGLRRAQGDEENMRKAFESVRRQLDEFK